MQSHSPTSASFSSVLRVVDCCLSNQFDANGVLVLVLRWSLWDRGAPNIDGPSGTGLPSQALHVGDDEGGVVLVVVGGGADEEGFGGLGGGLIYC